MKRTLVLLLMLAVLVVPISSAVLPDSVKVVRADDPEPVSIVIFREADTLTLYVPDKGLVSLEGLTIEATAIDGTKLSKRLEEFAAFRGLPFDRIVAPACFILESNLKTSSMPLEYREVPPEHVFTERLTPANMIWYDSVADEPRLILITRDSETFGQCPATLPQCEIVYTPPERSTVPPTAVPSHPEIKVIPITGRAIVQNAT